MTRRKPRQQKLSPAERARLALLQQEAKRERLVRAAERRADEIAALRDLMEDGYDLAAEHAPDGLDRWERAELERVNAGRKPSRRCRTLPLRCYEAKNLERYAKP